MFPNKGRIEDRLDRIEAVLRLAGITSEPDQPKPILASPVLVSAMHELMTSLLAKLWSPEELSRHADRMRQSKPTEPPPPGANWAERHAGEIIDAVADMMDQAAIGANEQGVGRA